MTTPQDHERILAQLPAVRAVRMAKGAAILVVAPIAWSPLVNEWEHYIWIVAGGGGLFCVLWCWFDRGVRQSAEAMLVSSIAFGSQAVVLALGLFGEKEPPFAELTNAEVSRVMQCGWPTPWVTVTREWLTSPTPLGPYTLHFFGYALALAISVGVVATVLLLNRRKLGLPQRRILHVIMTLLYFGAAFALYWRTNGFELMHG